LRRITYDRDRRLLRAANRSLPVIADTIDTVTALGFEPFEIRRVRVGFENGWQLSVVWGSGTYSSNRDHSFHRGEFVEEPTHVEVAIFNPAGEWAIDEPFTLDAIGLAVTADQVSRLPTDGKVELDPHGNVITIGSGAQ
jgi:hypothetical protein